MGEHSDIYFIYIGLADFFSQNFEFKYFLCFQKNEYFV